MTYRALSLGRPGQDLHSANPRVTSVEVYAWADFDTLAEAKRWAEDHPRVDVVDSSRTIVWQKVPS